MTAKEKSALLDIFTDEKGRAAINRLYLASNNVDQEAEAEKILQDIENCGVTGPKEIRSLLENFKSQVIKDVPKARAKQFIALFPRIFLNETFDPKRVVSTINSIGVRRFFGSENEWVEIIRNRVKNSPDGRPLAVVLFPQVDWNLAFRSDQNLFEELTGHGYRVVYYEVKSDIEFFDFLQEATREQAARVLMIGGHGQPLGLNFGYDSDYVQGENTLLYLGINDEQRMKDRHLAKSLEPGGQIILNSCSTGQGKEKKENLANMLSRVFPYAGHIWAPQEVGGLAYLSFDTDKIIQKAEYNVDEYDAAVMNIPRLFQEYFAQGDENSNSFKALLIMSERKTAHSIYFYGYTNYVTEADNVHKYLIEIEGGLGPNKQIKVLALFNKRRQSDNSSWSPLISRLVKNLIVKNAPIDNINILTTMDTLRDYQLNTSHSLELLLTVEKDFVADDHFSISSDQGKIATQIIIGLAKNDRAYFDALSNYAIDKGLPPATRRASAFLLGKLGDREAMPLLRKILGVGLFNWRDKDEALCQIAWHSLKEIRNGN